MPRLFLLVLGKMNLQDIRTEISAIQLPCKATIYQKPCMFIGQMLLGRVGCILRFNCLIPIRLFIPERESEKRKEGGLGFNEGEVSAFCTLSTQAFKRPSLAQCPSTLMKPNKSFSNANKTIDKGGGRLHCMIHYCPKFMIS